MSRTNVFSSLINSLTNNGVAGNVISDAVSAVGGSLGGVFNPTANQAKTKLAALAALSATPPAYTAAAPDIINEVESLTGSQFPETIPLLEKLRTATDPLTIAQTIAAIEQEI